MQTPAISTDCATIATIATFGVTLIVGLFQIVSGMANKLSDPNTLQPRIRNLVTRSWANRYHSLIGALTRKLDEFYSEPFSIEAFQRCISIAVFYPLGLYFLAWASNPALKFHGYSILPDVKSPLIAWMILVTTSVLFFIFLKFLKNLDIQSKLRLRLEKAGYTTKKAEHLVRGILLISIALFFWIVTSLTDPLNLSGIRLFSLFAAFSVVVTVMNWTSSFYVIPFFLIFGIAVNSPFYDFGQISLFILLFGGVFPIINAFFDFISLYWSRFFLERAKKRRGHGWFLVHIFVDAIIAIILLITLLMGIAVIYKLLALIPMKLPLEQFNPIYLAALAAVDPWGEGLYLTGMLITTLIPTIIHISLVLAAVSLNLGGKRLAIYLHNSNGDQMKLMLAVLWLSLYFVPLVLLIIASIWFVKFLMTIDISKFLFDSLSFLYYEPLPILLAQIFVVFGVILGSIWLFEKRRGASGQVAS